MNYICVCYAHFRSLQGGGINPCLSRMFCLIVTVCCVDVSFSTVVKRQVTPEELLTPGGPFIKKTFTIVGDAVGWGFVVRGSKPCHIQAVDPGGPAAAVGMKVCQFVVSVNGLNVLCHDYRTVSNLILTGPRTIVMEVMEEGYQKQNCNMSN
ncbi:hypothetical protein AMECASPLE_008969 [Ameca splendens]|uniref:PDZ domain-containing protein n=1 Tax=Ameca splendens TaxID=208324 RepID=A0ABV0YM65_9TELE